MTNRTTAGTSAALLGAACVLCAAMLWGTTGTLQAILPENRDPLAVAWFRIGIGAATLTALCLCVPTTRRALRRLPMPLVALAGTAIAAYNFLFFSGVLLAGVGVGTAIAIGSAPIWVSLYEWLVRKQAPSRLSLIGQAICIVGAVALVASNQAASNPLAGYLLTALAGIAYATYSVATHKIGPGQPFGAVAAATFAFAAILMAPVLVAADLSWMDTGSIPSILFLGVVVTGLSYYLYTYGVSRMPASTAVTLALAEPLTAWVLATLVVGEALTPLKAAGAAIVLFGLFLVTRSIASR
ncbi:MAG: EamA family transporter [Pseudomonadota bacterium]